MFIWTNFWSSEVTDWASRWQQWRRAWPALAHISVQWWRRGELQRDFTL